MGNCECLSSALVKFYVCPYFTLGIEGGVWDDFFFYLLLFYSEEWDQQLKTIREVFERLSKAKLTINLAKYKFTDRSKAEFT